MPFTVPVDKRYEFILTFESQSTEERWPVEIIGTRYDHNYCGGDVPYQEIPEEMRKGLGRPIPFRVVIRRIEDRGIIIDRSFNSLCFFASNRTQIDREIGWVELTRGDFIAEVTNIESQTGLESVKTYILLTPGHGK